MAIDCAMRLRLQRAEEAVLAGRAEHEVDAAAPLAQALAEREQRRLAVPAADQHAADRVLRQREGPAERSDDVDRRRWRCSAASHAVPRPVTEKTISTVPP